LGVNVLLDHPANVLAAVHAAAGGFLVHWLFQFQRDRKRQAHKFFLLAGVMFGFLGHNIKILFDNIELEVK
jgi:hypothetical protein